MQFPSIAAHAYRQAAPRRSSFSVEDKEDASAIRLVDATDSRLIYRVPILLVIATFPYLCFDKFERAEARAEPVTRSQSVVAEIAGRNG